MARVGAPLHDIDVEPSRESEDFHACAAVGVEQGFRVGGRAKFLPVDACAEKNAGQRAVVLPGGPQQTLGGLKLRIKRLRPFAGGWILVFFGLKEVLAVDAKPAQCDRAEVDHGQPGRDLKLRNDPTRDVGIFREGLQARGVGNVMEDGLHEGAVEGRSRIEGGDDSARRWSVRRQREKRAEAGVSDRRGIELGGVSGPVVNAINRGCRFPIDQGRIERTG